MISALDETIKQLLIKNGRLDPAEVDISFDMPDREWSASVSKPTVNIYLYDVRENVDLRNYEWSVAHNNGTATKTKAPRRVDLSYLITVWANDTADQHRLLGHLLAVLFKYPELPEELLQGVLKGVGWPIRTFVAQPDGAMRNTADFWSALDNNLKPSINLVVTIPVDLDVDITAPEVKTTVFKFGDTTSPGLEDTIQISGVVRYKDKPDQAVPGASILVKELQMTSSTDENGNYVFRRMTQGSYTFEVSAPGEKKRQVPVSVPGPSYDIEL